VEPASGAFAELARRVKLQAPTVAYLSNLTGAWITPKEATDPAYWAKHMRHPVRFGDGLAELLKDPNCILLEVGPGRSLSVLAQRQMTGAQMALASLPQAKHQYRMLPHLLETLGKLWVAGIEIDWDGFYAGQRRRRLSLPTYPFERQRYWVDAADAPPDGNSAAVGSPRQSPKPRRAVVNPATSPADAAAAASEGGEAAGAHADEDPLERVLARQLHVMTQQLRILDQRQPE
jgi:acyl transferase domain-containing protein